MYKFLGQIIFVGLMIGILVTAVTMLFSFSIFYVLEATEVLLFPYFMNYAGWVSLALGVIGTLAWYIYIMSIARSYFLRLVDTFLGKKK